MFNEYACNNRASKYMEQNLTTEIDKPAIIVGDFNILFSVTNRTSVHKIHRE